MRDAREKKRERNKRPAFCVLLFFETRKRKTGAY